MIGGTAWRALLLLVGAAAVAAAVGHLTSALVRRVAARRAQSGLASLGSKARTPWLSALISVTVLLTLPAARLPAKWYGSLHHLAVISTIITVSWLTRAALHVAEDAAFMRLRMDMADNRRRRRARTQINAVGRLTTASIVVVAAAAILMSFSGLRAFGTSILASAGVAGVLAGLAAQTTLSNVFAGLQLAFTDALRIDDVVVVDDEWGRIEEVTLTYVVLHVWDERRLVLPTSYFTQNPFQNWTRTESRVIGAVVLHLDFSAPIHELRREAQRLVEGSPLWDRRDWVLQVTDTTETTIVVRVLASAADAGSAWDLRCDVREGLIDYIQRTCPHALPRLRTDLRSDLGTGDGEAALVAASAGESGR